MLIEKDFASVRVGGNEKQALKVLIHGRLAYGEFPFFTLLLDSEQSQKTKAVYFLPERFILCMCRGQ